MHIRNNIKKVLSLVVILGFGTVILSCQSPSTSLTDKSNTEKLTVLIIDGQNNHKVWPKSTFMMKHMLEQTGKFTVSIYRTSPVWQSERYLAAFPLNDGKLYQEGDPVTDPSFLPNFSDYDVIVSNFGWRAAKWPQQTQTAFEEYMRNGGGFVTVHAANNAFPEWKEYNKMIGLGGWGGRNQESGPYIYYNDNGVLQRDMSKGNGGGHGKQHEFLVTMRDTNHPITQGLPKQWLKTRDELYNRLRGPAENMTVLASAFDSKEHNGSGRHEPILMTIDYHKGRIFHTTLGHDVPAFEGVGFISTFTRGTEWAATGKVTIPVPDDFPSATTTSKRKFIP